MWISKLQLRNVRCFVDSNLLEFSKGINVLIGPNNSGKSTILKALYYLQKPASLTVGDIRKGETDFTIDVHFENGNFPSFRVELPNIHHGVMLFKQPQNSAAGRQIRSSGTNNVDPFHSFSEREPNNFHISVPVEKKSQFLEP